MKDTNLVNALREHAEWQRGNEWETPITLGDDLAEAADRIEAQAKEIEKLRAQLRHLEELAEAADVAPVVYTRWAHLGGDEWCCPVCGFVITTEGSWDKPTKKYCEDCGAKMDGGADHESG